jgi:hypothetical protein
MRVKTVLTLAAFGAAYYLARRFTPIAPRSGTPNPRLAPVVMWYETPEERASYCEGSD